jgi:N-acetylglucosamine-6-phosphate deacetylase
LPDTKPDTERGVLEFTCRNYRNNEAVSVRIVGKGAHVTPTGVPVSSPALLYAPGFIDIQINGYGGVNFSEPSTLDAEGIGKLVHSLWRQGVVYFLPTVVTGGFDSMRRSIDIITASRQDPEIGRSIPGIHLEGPYISSEDGPRGAHPKEHARPPSWEEFSRWQEAANGAIKLVTLAPELPGAIGFIDRLRREGILVAIGHTNACSQAIADAVAAGAMLSTHLGNAAHARIKRHPNYIWDQLAADGLGMSLIVDGHHLPPAVVKVMIRAKGALKSLLISDAAPIAGLSPGRYQFAGKAVELTAEGQVKLLGTDYLAGSALTLPNAVHNVSRFAQITPKLALDMASHHPSRLLNHGTGLALEVFDARTFTVLEWQEEELGVSATVLGGAVCYAKSAI